MRSPLTWTLLIGGLALTAGAAALWLERGNAMLLDLSSSLSAFMCF